MENVKVFMKGSQVATTNSQGIYTLDGMRASTYRIQFKAGIVAVIIVSFYYLNK